MSASQPLRTGARVVVTYGERSTSVYTGVITELKEEEALIKWDGVYLHLQRGGDGACRLR